MIKLVNINKNYKNLCVYKNFNLDIEENKILCILGESGSGKSTLLNIIANLTDYQGEIINNKDKISYIFQEDRLIDNLTVMQNLEFVSEDTKKNQKILKSVELEKYADKYPNQLSGGMKRRVSIARAFCYDSNFLLMDEPFSNLDIGLKLRLIEIFRNMRSENKITTVFVTHDLEEALMLSDRIIFLKDGKIQKDIIMPNEKRCYGCMPEIKKQLLECFLKKN